MKFLSFVSAARLIWLNVGMGTASEPVGYDAQPIVDEFAEATSPPGRSCTGNGGMIA